MNLDNYAKIATIVAAIGTIFFNLLLWLATRSSAKAANDSAQASKDSAQVAKDSLAFHKEQIKTANEELAFMKREYLKRIKKDATYIHDTVAGVANDLASYVALRNSYDIQRPSPYELSKYFNEEQQEVINKIWDLYERYYSYYWFDSITGEFTTNFYDKDELIKGSKLCSFEIEKLIQKLK